MTLAERNELARLERELIRAESIALQVKLKARIAWLLQPAKPEPDVSVSVTEDWPE